MKLCSSRSILGLLIFFVAACGIEDEPGGFRIISYTFDFNTSKHDWIPGFAEFPSGPDDSTFYELQFAHTALPDSHKRALMLSGNNHSDDLFMYVKKKITNLDPNTPYTLTFEVEMESDAQKASVGAGGSPGQSVYVKVGASKNEPKTLIDDDYYIVNIDKGDQSQSGADMIVIGDISIPSDSSGYVAIKRTNAPLNNNSYNSPIVATTNSDGEMWLIVGTDSGYEGITTLYYTNINIVLSRSK
jgi:hypothetical protein